MAAAAPPPVPKHFALLYSYVPDILEKRGPYRAEHLRLAQESIVKSDMIIGGVLADPVDGCDGRRLAPPPPDEAADVDDGGRVVLGRPKPKPVEAPLPNRTFLLAQRGKCTFVDKARAARDGGFDGLLIFNTDASGLIPMPAGGAATDDLDVPAFMVDNGVGKALERVLRWKETTRVEAWVGSSDACVSLSPPLVRPPPRPTDPEDLEDWPDVAGNATFQCGPRSLAVPFVSATFGAYASPDRAVPLAVAAPPHLCSLTGVERRVAGMAALVLRGGGCGFSEKALVAQKLGAALLVVVNSGDGAMLAMAADPALALSVPAVMVDHAAQEQLEKLMRAPGCSPSGDVLVRLAYDEPPPEEVEEETPE